VGTVLKRKEVVLGSAAVKTDEAEATYKERPALNRLRRCFIRISIIRVAGKKSVMEWEGEALCQGFRERLRIIWNNEGLASERRFPFAIKHAVDKEIESVATDGIIADPQRRRCSGRRGNCFLRFARRRVC